MNELDGAFVALCYALHVHQARRVGTRDILGTRGYMPRYLVLSHARRYVGFFDGKHSAEAAALVLTLGFAYGYALDETKKVDDFTV